MKYLSIKLTQTFTKSFCLLLLTLPQLIFLQSQLSVTGQAIGARNQQIVSCHLAHTNYKFLLCFQDNNNKKIHPFSFVLFRMSSKESCKSFRETDRIYQKVAKAKLSHNFTIIEAHAAEKMLGLSGFGELTEFLHHQPNKRIGCI